MMTKCSWEGCKATSEAPATDGWAFLADWQGIKDGWYCNIHPTFDPPERDPSEPKRDDGRNRFAGPDAVHCGGTRYAGGCSQLP